MKVGDIEISWLGHAGFLIENSKVIYIDPYNISEGLPEADIIFITHSHYDHCSIEDLNKIVRDGTRVVLPVDCQSKVVRFDKEFKLSVASVGQEIELCENIRVFAVPAYNVDKHFHPQEEEWVGYLLKIDNVLIYHAGDTDKIPEMQRLTGHNHARVNFVALLPVGGRFTMNAEEAAEVATMIKPNVAVPMHYGDVIGSDDDAREFAELCEENGIKVEILKKR